MRSEVRASPSSARVTLPKNRRERPVSPRLPGDDEARVVRSRTREDLSRDIAFAHLTGHATPRLPQDLDTLGDGRVGPRAGVGTPDEVRVVIVHVRKDAGSPRPGQ